MKGRFILLVGMGSEVYYILDKVKMDKTSNDGSKQGFLIGKTRLGITFNTHGQPVIKETYAKGIKDDQIYLANRVNSFKVITIDQIEHIVK